jgi:hypothetical protein
MILNRKIYSRRKSINRLDRKSNNNRVRQHRQSKKNQKGGNYFLGLDQPRIGGLSVVSYQDDLYAQAGPNVNIAYTDINLKNINNTCIKGGSVIYNKKYNKKNNIKNNKKGGSANFSPDMNTRTFDCYQPNWTENCV